MKEKGNFVLRAVCILNYVTDANSGGKKQNKIPTQTQTRTNKNPQTDKASPKPCSLLTRLVKAWLIFGLFLSGLEVKWMPSRTISCANAAETEKAVGSCEKN